jgi:hypothetical protein
MISSSTAAPGYGTLNDGELQEYLNTGVEFIQIAYDRSFSKEKLLVSDGCGPIVRNKEQYNSISKREFIHNCNTVPGSSGGGQFVIRDQESWIFCVQLGTTGAGADKEFDLKKNTNICTNFDESFLARFERDARRIGDAPDVRI